MNLNDIQTAVQFELWVFPAIIGSELISGLVQLEPSGASGEYNLVQKGKLIKVCLREKHQQNDISFHLKRGCAKLAQIIQTAKDGSALLKVNFFNGSVIEMGEIEIGIDERIETTAKRIGFKFQETEDLASLLNKKTFIEMSDSDSDDYFLIMAGVAADEDFDLIVGESDGSVMEEKGVSNKPSEPIQNQLRCFSIYGDGLRIPVERRMIDKDSEIFFATRLINKQDNNAKGSLRLAKGKIFFSDYSKTGLIRALASGSMSRLLQTKGSYLKQWDKYGAVEGELLLTRSRSIGKLEYSNFELTGKGVKFFFQEQLSSGLSEGDEMEITSVDPLYFQNPDLTWEQYSNYLEEEFKAKREFSKDTSDNNEPSFATIVNVDSNSLTLDIPAPPSGNGKFLVLSINGDKIQIERRMKARKLILEGRSANPLLGLLIEEGGDIPDIQRITKLKPLTPFVREKIFKHDPTEVQVKAIEIALNTPDIALIQGPPGTGKTTVITAILERLNEEHDKTRSIRGEILVSGFQHDAVENIVSRLSVNALPAVKFGRRSGDSEFTEDAVSKKIETWCKDVAKRLRTKNPQIIQTEDQRMLAELFNLYALSPSLNNAINLLNRILLIPRNILTPQLVEQTTLLLDSLNSEAQFGQSFDRDSLKAIRSLRVSEEGFLDDGKERSADILERFEGALKESEKRVLKEAIFWKEGRDLTFLQDLRGIKLKLLELCTPRPQYRIEKPREDILGLIGRVSMHLEKQKSSKNQVDIILANFLHELEDNPDGIREAIEDYNFVFAATTQQAEGSAIRRAKTKDKDDFVKYDTVIVDEAARTSPRDLLIPMAQAEKRIILVGDHRQLPHLIDEEVAKSLETEEDQESANLKQDYVKTSMFEYLFNRLKKLEQSDGIRRTVTLDAQYRMHPMLGQFVSDNFYEQYGEGYRSPLPKHLFEHHLADTNNRSAAWLNVPHKDGKEEKRGTSRCRPAEAEAIANRLKSWIDSEKGKNLSFGVISFYKAQVYAVFEKLSKHGITKKSSDGAWDIADDYKFLKKENNGNVRIEERFRIGTVDAFQGMEFDVVFLSIVRSQDIKRLPSYIKRENDQKKIQRGIFGHLMSENRLCVSMSRQKRLLVLVGDSELVQTDIGKESVPALGKYFELCTQKGVLL